jgi:hydroxymethylglutaryl-CoA reductase
MVDNVIATYALPMAVAPGFVINGKSYVVPMVCEEPFVVGCAERGARLAAENGGFHATGTGSIMISQVQLTGLAHPVASCAKIMEHKTEILSVANEADFVLVGLGGGAFDVETRSLSSESGPMVIVHLLVNTLDAMGANAVNTMAERVAPFLEQITGGRAYLRILSNLAIHRLVRVRVRISKESLGGEDVVNGIIAAHAFAFADPFRAATSNKGTMNGAIPVATVTGNDTRAIEAGVHAYACRTGTYRPVTVWERDAEGNLHGVIEIPMAVGIVGGTTRHHPLAGIALRMMGIQSAEELGMVIAATGLAENLWTLRTLTTGGLQEQFVPALKRGNSLFDDRQSK